MLSLPVCAGIVIVLVLVCIPFVVAWLWSVRNLGIGGS